MRRIRHATVHAMACTCRRCRPRAATNHRTASALKAATRVLLLIAAIIAIPFIVAWALASANGGSR